MKLRSLVLAGMIAAGLGAPAAFAHHSFAMFASDKTMTLKGTVKEFEWTNPHAWVHLVVMTPEGKSEDWSFEMASPQQLVSRGWKSDALKVGDQITMVAHPMKDGTHGGQYVSVTLADGKVLGLRPPG